MAVTWSTNSSNQVTVSNGGLTATASGSTAGARSNTTWSSGKLYFEITVLTSRSPAANELVGIANVYLSIYAQPGLGNPSNSVGIDLGYPGLTPAAPQVVYYNNAYASAAGPNSIPVGNVIGIAVDFTNSLLWYTSDQMITDTGAGSWNNSTTSNPATGTSGVSFASTAGVFFLAWYTDTVGNAITLNATGAFHFTMPSGFSALDPTIVGVISATQGAQYLARDSASENSLTALYGINGGAPSGTVAIGGVLSTTQAAQTLAATGTITFPARTGPLSATQAPQTLAATGSVTTGATAYGPLTATQAQQTLSASGTVTTVARLGVISATQAAQTLVASGFVGVVASPNVIWMD